MSKRGNIVLPALMALAVVALVYGVTHLLVLRFTAGDIYPAYSSLRADPLGTKVLCEALGRLPGCATRRNLRPLEELEGADTVTLVFAGATERDLCTLDTADAVAQFAGSGGRVVIALLPTPPPRSATGLLPVPARESDDRPQPPRRKAGESRKKPPADKKGCRDGTCAPLRALCSTQDSLGFALAWVDTGRESVTVPALLSEPLHNARTELPTQVSWHSPWFFRRFDADWHVVYTRNEHPVMLQRKLGNGTLVVATDSYFLSNEAMRAERYPGLLAWLVGRSAATVIFEETHLGVFEEPGIAALLRRYRLHGLAAGLFVLTGLFVWQRMSRLVPPPAAAAPGDTTAAVSGRDASAGLVNLLRRGIAPGELLGTCVDEWAKAAPRHDHADTTAKLTQARTLVQAESARPATKRDTAATYKAICATLAERRPKQTEGGRAAGG